MTDTATPEELAKVRRYECTMHGHSFSEVRVHQTLAPQRVICTNCGSHWAVVNPGANWGDDPK